LAYVAVGQVDGALGGLQAAIASARADLRDDVAPAVITEVIDALQREQASLEAARRSVRLVADALRGVRLRPRL
jgi:hypothetical protein